MIKSNFDLEMDAGHTEIWLAIHNTVKRLNNIQTICAPGEEHGLAFSLLTRALAQATRDFYNMRSEIPMAIEAKKSGIDALISLTKFAIEQLKEETKPCQTTQIKQ